MKLDKEDFKHKFGEWWRYFEPLFDKTEVMENIYAELKATSMDKKTICPASSDVFNSFLATSPDQLKAIFVLLDPYPQVKKGVRVSCGIAMDCRNTEPIGEPIQPSLRKFYEAIEHSEADGLDLKMLHPHSLEYLTSQGVMLFNSALTVVRDKTGSHTKLWAPFMHYFYETVMSHFSGMIYVLCGKESQKMEKWIDPLANHIFKIEHPSHAERQYRPWNYDDIFKKINYIIKHNNGEEMKIVWRYEEPPF